jgi:hypothetical protein
VQSGHDDAVEVGGGDELDRVIAAQPPTGRVDATGRAAGQGEDGAVRQHILGNTEVGLDGGGHIDEDVDRAAGPHAFEDLPVACLDGEADGLRESGLIGRTRLGKRIGDGHSEGFARVLRGAVGADFGDPAHEDANQGGHREHLFGAGGHGEQPLRGQQ